MTRRGLMLYTVRDECARDFEAALREVRAIGYDGVEIFDLHGHDARAVRAWLDDNGLVACGRHADLRALEKRLPDLATECHELGIDRVVLSWIEVPETADVATRLADRIAAIAPRARELGLVFGFHNHASEVRPLDGGRTFLDELLDRGDVFL